MTKKMIKKAVVGAKKAPGALIKKIPKRDVRSTDYYMDLIESLKKPEYAEAYLNAAIEESLKGDIESQAVLLIALRNVAQAQGNMSALARRAHMRREAVYKMLSGNGNPHLFSFTSLISAMGYGMQIYKLED